MYDVTQSVLITSQGLAVISPLAICVAFFSIIGTLSIGISVFPQTIDTIKNQQTQTFSWLMYVFLVVGCFFLAIYGIGLVEAGGRIAGNYYSAQNLALLQIAFAHWLTKGHNNTDLNAFITQLQNKGGLNPSDATSLAIAAILAGKTSIASDQILNGAAIHNSSAFDASKLLAEVQTQIDKDPTVKKEIASLLGADYGNLNNYYVITPGMYRNYQVNYTTPGGLLILGEGFASITSAIVLYYKLRNMIGAKKAGITEAEYCTRRLEEIKAKKGAK